VSGHLSLFQAHYTSLLHSTKPSRLDMLFVLALLLPGLAWAVDLTRELAIAVGLFVYSLRALDVVLQAPNLSNCTSPCFADFPLPQSVFDSCHDFGCLCKLPAFKEASYGCTMINVSPFSPGRLGSDFRLDVRCCRVRPGRDRHRRDVQHRCTGSSLGVRLTL
jgi:hypothetical protein